MERTTTTTTSNNATDSTTTTDNNTMDSTIQSIAEEHLYKIYEMQYKVAPTRVLLTVVSDDDDDGASAAIAAATGGDEGPPGIIVKSAYLGGVVGFPTPDEDDEDDFVLPARSELDRMTLTAFEIPGYGEYFFRELQRSYDVGLDGLMRQQEPSQSIKLHLPYRSSCTTCGNTYNGSTNFPCCSRKISTSRSF
jgi:hypothetical protein